MWNLHIWHLCFGVSCIDTYVLTVEHFTSNIFSCTSFSHLVHWNETIAVHLVKTKTILQSQKDLSEEVELEMPPSQHPQAAALEARHHRNVFCYGSMGTRFILYFLPLLQSVCLSLFHPFCLDPKSCAQFDLTVSSLLFSSFSFGSVFF